MAQLITMFLTIFVAELGDKTQIATLLFASERQNSPWVVRSRASAAAPWCWGSALSVIMGAYGGRWLEHVPLKLIAGIGFILIGVFSVVQFYRGETEEPSSKTKGPAPLQSRTLVSFKRGLECN